MKKILFFCGNPPHPIHKKLAESINADFYYFPTQGSILEKLKSIWKIPKDYNLYLSEGLFGYLNMAKKLGRINKRSKTMNLFSDPRLYQICSGIKFDFKVLKPKRYNIFLKKYQTNSIKNLDYALCIGRYQKELLKKIAPKLKTITIPPMVERKIFFNPVKSPLKENNIYFLGGGPDYNYKGLDLLIEIFNEVNKKFPKSKLYVVGAGWGDFKKNVKNKKVFFVGKKSQKEMVKIMKDCSICVHLGRGEATGISILEAMLKGLPTIVSEETGAKEYVKEADKNFIKNLKDKEGITNSIKEYFNLSTEKKQILGKKFRQVAIGLTEKNSINVFREEIKKII